MQPAQGPPEDGSAIRIRWPQPAPEYPSSPRRKSIVSDTALVARRPRCQSDYFRHGRSVAQSVLPGSTGDFLRRLLRVSPLVRDHGHERPPLMLLYGLKTCSGAITLSFSFWQPRAAPDRRPTERPSPEPSGYRLSAYFDSSFAFANLW